MILAPLPFLRLRPWVLFNFSSFLILPQNNLARKTVFASKIFSMGVIICLVLALSGPVYKAKEILRIEEGAQIVFVRDVSSSMFTKQEDEEGSVLNIDIASKLIKDFVYLRPGDEYALVDFGSAVVTRSGFLSDKKEFTSILFAPTTDLSGTVIDQALMRAISFFESTESINSRAIILLSDGVGRLDGVEDMVYWFSRVNVNFWWVFIGDENNWKTSDDMFGFINKYSLVGNAKAFRANNNLEIAEVINNIRSLESGIIRRPVEGSNHLLAPLLFKTAFALLCLLGIFVLFGLMVRKRKDG